MSSKDASLYGAQRPRKLAGGNEISSSTTLSFASQLSSLISSSNQTTGSKSTSSRPRPKKEDIFSTHNRNTAKRAKRDLEDSPAFEQKHTTNGEALDKGVWERSKRKMEQKARLYAAMKRGDVEDVDERYAVDFDSKWAQAREDGLDDDLDDDDDDDDDGTAPPEQVEYTDELGRTRTGTRAEVARAQRILQSQADVSGDRFTARPSAPAHVIYGDTIQHQAFVPDAPIAAQMERLAQKRDRSLTPPPDEHFDAGKEVRTKGTGFFRFSGDAEERNRQMEGLKSERAETERRRLERDERLLERKRLIEERRNKINQLRSKRKADEFLDQLGEEWKAKADESAAAEMTERIEAAVEREDDDDDADG